MKTGGSWKRRGLIIFLILLAAGLLGAFAKLGAPGASDMKWITFAVKRGDLVIDVLESGSIQASESLVIKSEVEGTTTIISIIPEGTLLTEKDVEETKVLVELDSANLRERSTQQEIEVQSATAEFIDARESYDIQVKQNESNQKAGELKLRFAEMDIDKYLGEDVAGWLISGSAELSSIVDNEALGGEALQKKHKLQSEIDLAEEEAARASSKLEWTKDLESRGYVRRDDLKADELALERAQINLEQASTSLYFFRRYEIRKEAERLRSDYEEATRELARIKAKNRSELAKAKARVESTLARYGLKVDQLRKIREQIEKCTIVATQPGLVVYGGSDEPWRRDRVQEGAQVHEQQEILTIPNSGAMAVKAQVHESMIARVREGQRATVKVAATPDESLEGKVTKVGVIPDSENRWLNPDLKVYETEVTLLGDHPELRPEMSAEIRIIVDEIKDVLMVPMEAVLSRDEDRVCYLVTPSGRQEVPVQTGEYNDKFIEIKEGLDEGQEVILNAADLLEHSVKVSGEQKPSTPSLVSPGL